MAARMREEDVRDVVLAAAAGDTAAWERLVDTYAGLVWAIARGFRLGYGDACDVTQTTWLRLVESINRLEDPSRVGAWLATTARRECMRILNLSARQIPVAELDRLPDRAVTDAGSVDSALLASEQESHVRKALSQLPPRSQQLMRLLMLDPPPSYEEISDVLAIPIGSIGPTRGRCLTKLQGMLSTELERQSVSAGSA